MPGYSGGRTDSLLCSRALNFAWLILIIRYVENSYTLYSDEISVDDSEQDANGLTQTTDYFLTDFALLISVVVE